MKIKHYTPLKFQIRLKKCVDESGMTNSEIAEKVGCYRKTIGAYYFGDSTPDIVTFMK